jgi:hypothetical protein
MGKASISEVTNGGKSVIEAEFPYVVHVKIVGCSDLIFHAWDCDAIEAQMKAKKGSAAKKTDNLDSYVRRNEGGFICLPTEYLRMSVVNAAKFRQDPRSPRKSASDLYKAAVVSLSPLSPIVMRDGKLAKDWEYEHRCRVMIQRSGITRTRPAFKEGWSAELSLMVNLPQYVSPADLHETLTMAGKVIGVGDFRPTYGRFQVTLLEVQPN